ncbi:MAG: hypothetical protein ACLUUW_03250 [Blautia wexlerae]
MGRPISDPYKWKQKYRSVYAPSYNEVKQKLFNSKKESEITLLSQKSRQLPKRQC